MSLSLHDGFFLTLRRLHTCRQPIYGAGCETNTMAQSDYVCKIGIRSFGSEKIAQMAWLSVSVANTGNRQQDMTYRLQNASRALQANTWILCDKHASIALRLNFFDAMVTSAACFAAGHRKLCVGELRKLDVHCRKLLRRIVAPPCRGCQVEWTMTMA